MGSRITQAPQRHRVNRLCLKAGSAVRDVIGAGNLNLGPVGQRPRLPIFHPEAVAAGMADTAIDGLSNNPRRGPPAADNLIRMRQKTVTLAVAADPAGAK